jgi:hypothetical protein
MRYRIPVIALLFAAVATALAVDFAPYRRRAAMTTTGESGEWWESYNPSALWFFSEGTGSTAYDATTNDVDITLTGATWTNRKPGVGGLCFDGINDTGVASNRACMHHTNAVSMAAWVFPVVGQSLSIIGAGDSGAPHTFSYRLQLVGGTNLGAIVSADGQVDADSSKYYISLTPLGSNWVHVASTYDCSSLVLYVNGIQRSVGRVNHDAEVPSIFISPRQLRVGHIEYDTLLYYYAGAVQEIMVSGRAWTSNEVYSLFLRGE